MAPVVAATQPQAGPLPTLLPQRRGRSRLSSRHGRRSRTSIAVASAEAPDNDSGSSDAPAGSTPRWPLTALETAYLAWLGASDA